MPPYADKIQKLTGLPVFNSTTLTTMVYNVVTSPPIPRRNARHLRSEI